MGLQLSDQMTNPEQILSRPPRVLLTGRPGSGKTTVIRRAVELIGSGRCRGFFTEEVREGGRRIGFNVVTLDGQCGPLARVGAPGPRVSRYGVDLRSFERLGVEPLEGELTERAGVLVVDEIGKMELFSDRFVGVLKRIFDPGAGWAILGTVMLGRHPKVDWLRRQSDIRFIEVTAANRDGLATELSGLFAEFLRAG
jgi:nucleoside-triphosphatase